MFLGSRLKLIDAQHEIKNIQQKKDLTIWFDRKQIIETTWIPKTYKNIYRGV